MTAAQLRIGMHAVACNDSSSSIVVPLWLLYPTTALETEQRFGPYVMMAALDADVARERAPLIVISHGTGGTPWTHRVLATALVRQGFVVALIEHPGNNRNDDRLAKTRQNLEDRPRHVRLAIDAALADELVGAHLDPERIAILGHSLGGYTALAVAGGRPSSLPYESPDGLAHALHVEADPRVRALVLLAPAAAWYAAQGALDAMHVPTLLLTAEHDVHVPHGFADVILRGVPDATRVERRTIANAGHFSFLSPFPAALSTIDPAKDPAGFDRAAFQVQLAREVGAFLRDELR